MQAEVKEDEAVNKRIPEIPQPNPRERMVPDETLALLMTVLTLSLEKSQPSAARVELEFARAKQKVLEYRQSQG